MSENDYRFDLIKEIYIEVGRVHAWQASHALPFAMRSLTVWLSSLYSMPVRWSIKMQRRLIMHPSFHEQMSKQRMEALQREAALTKRAKSVIDNTAGNQAFTRILWYLLFGLHIPASSQKLNDEYTLRGFQAHLNATMWMVGFVALGLGLLIGGFLYSSFGLMPIVLLTSSMLVVVSIPILMRSASVLSNHSQVPSHR